MKVKFANKVFEVLYTMEVAGLTMYAVEDEPNHIDWLTNVEVVDAEKKELRKTEQKQVIDYPDSLPKDNWELVHEFVSKFGRVPKDEDELNVLVEYILKRQKLWNEEDENIRLRLIDY